MSSVVLSAAGSAIGGAIAGPAGAAIGYAAGNFVGGMIDNRLSPGSKHKISGHRLSSLLVQTSTYGKVIPKIFGQCRVSGNVIWSLPLQEHENTNVHTARGGKGKKNRVTQTSYSYTVTLAIAICEGEIESINNMWADAKLITPYLANCRVYYGDEKQMPDPTIQAHQGISNTPAYRGLSYIVIENFPLEEYGNRIPNFTFEVKALPVNSSLTNHQQLEEKIRSVCIIPGLGEFVYDTKIQCKAYGKKVDGKVIQAGKAEAINSNNNMAKANSLVSLDQLERSCKNLKWVSPVVCWFGTSLQVSQCRILPGIEHRDTLTYPEEWGVGIFNRQNAHLITYKNDRPIYGGTPSDTSVLRYIEELKARNLDIMFCPMLMIDKSDKPWRGHLTGGANDLEEFCSDYSKFILHYAHLLTGKIDAFVIGSEFPGLTSIKTANNNFLFVDYLVNLAKKVKNILGPEIKVVYAADWSEYHHTKGGWYNLDPLWSSSDIDVIGINAYFPLTSAELGGQITRKDIESGWFSGEGYDYFIRKNQQVTLQPEYAWKNIEFWWKNTHINPDGKATNWRPSSKKVWFTEFGFASIDKTTNEPNVFFDPESSVGGIPKNSNGSPCHLSQRIALETTLDIWNKSEMVEEMFIWCWDARPYPYWPQMTHYWSDGYKWSRGHWLNGKLSLCTLADIIVYLCGDSGIDVSQVDVSSLGDIIIDGFVIDYTSANREHIEHLCLIYDIECVESEGYLKFFPRSKLVDRVNIFDNDLLPNSHGHLIEISYENINTPYSVECLYFDKLKLYQQNIARITNDSSEHNDHVVINSNLVANSSTIDALLNKINYAYLTNKYLFKFYLPPSYIYLEPGDLIELSYNNSKYTIKANSLNRHNKGIIEVIGSTFDINYTETAINFFVRDIPKVTLSSSTIPASGDYVIEVLDIPNFRNNNELSPVIYLATSVKSGVFKPIHIEYTDNVTSHIYQYSEYLTSEATMGNADCSLLSANINHSILDYQSSVRVYFNSGMLSSVNYETILSQNNVNLAVIGGELIQFMNVECVANNEYILSGLKRGCFGTESKILGHSNGYERFVLLDHNLHAVELPISAYNNKCKYRILDKENEQYTNHGEFIWQATSIKPLSPVNISYKIDEEKNCHINWFRRAKVNGGWLNNVEVPLEHSDEKYAVILKSSKDDSVLYEEISIKNNTVIDFKLLDIDSNQLALEVYQLSPVVGMGDEAKKYISMY